MQSNHRTPRQHLKVDPQEFRLPRDGMRDLSFKGWRIADAHTENAMPRANVLIEIYVTEGGQYVGYIGTEVTHRDPLVDQVAPGVYEGPPRERSGRTTVSYSGEDILNFLVEDNGGRLGGLGRDAWYQACRTYEPLRPLEVETIV